MKVYRVAQGSAEWYKLRAGRPTASNFHKIITPKGAPSAQAIKYMYRLIAERLLNETMDDELGFVQWIGRGKEQEPNACATFEFLNEVPLEPGGFITSNDGRIGASPDRMVKGNREGVEVKCPSPWVQIQYLLDGPGDDYRPQVQGHLLAADEFQAVHFWSWHPQMPPLHRVTLRDRGYQPLLASALDTFCDNLDRATERARALGAYAVARRMETPGDVAYQAEADVQLKFPDGGDLGDS
jgi:YqaJ-like viral recombinase domain